MSPKNSAPAIVNMMEKTNCRRVISQASLAPLINEVKAELDGKGVSIKIDDLLSLKDVFPSLRPQGKANGTGHGVTKGFKSYPSSKMPFDDNAVVVYIHSSGSTGFPKPIPHTHKTQRSWCRGGKYRYFRVYLKNSRVTVNRSHVRGTNTPGAVGLHGTTNIPFSRLFHAVYDSVRHWRSGRALRA